MGLYKEFTENLSHKSGCATEEHYLLFISFSFSFPSPSVPLLPSSSLILKPVPSLIFFNFYFMYLLARFLVDAEEELRHTATDYDLKVPISHQQITDSLNYCLRRLHPSSYAISWCSNSMKQVTLKIKRSHAVGLYQMPSVGIPNFINQNPKTVITPQSRQWTIHGTPR